MAKRRTPKPKPSANKPFQWRPTDHLPLDEDLLIVFHGLMSFSYLFDPKHDPEEERFHCQVGVFNRDPEHQLKITIEGGTCAGSYQYTHAQLKPLVDEKFRLEIVEAVPNVDFYQCRGTFNRITATDAYDFRWLIDVETPDLYNNVTRRKKKHYGPKILVKNGTFFTQEKTLSTFKFVERSPGSEEQMLGSIAYCTAAKIKLDGQRARFAFTPPGATEPIECTFNPRRPGGPPAKIFVTNLCYRNGVPCEDNDFHLHFGTFSPPSGKRLCDLRVVRPEKAKHECAGLRPLNQLKVGPRATDDAPCHSMGYGRSGGGTGG